MDESDKDITLNERVNSILSDRAKVNDIVDLIEELDGNDTTSVVECIEGLGKIFSRFVKSGECSPLGKGRSPQKKRKKNAQEAEEIYFTWLNRKYRVVVGKLLKLLHCSDLAVQEQSLSTLMGLLTAESKKLQENSDRYIFPNEFFLRIVSNLTDGSTNMENVIKLFKEHLQYVDICYYLLRNLSRIVSKILEAGPQTKGSNRYFGRNVFYLLRQVSVPQSEDDMNCLFSNPHDSSGHKFGSAQSIDHSVTNLASHRKVFTGAWTSFLNLTLDTDIHRQVLVILHEKVMPHLLDAKILIDFLTDSYNIDGITSILSLNGLFVLIQQYNLDYPDFYKKLYSLFDTEIFHLKYRERFFQLADLFLTSTHLPAYLVAAFIKRLSRLAIRAPPFGVALCVTFVGNLIQRHPNCKVLIHRKVTFYDYALWMYVLLNPFRGKGAL